MERSCLVGIFLVCVLVLYLEQVQCFDFDSYYLPYKVDVNTPGRNNQLETGRVIWLRGTMTSGFFEVQFRTAEDLPLNNHLYLKVDTKEYITGYKENGVLMGESKKETGMNEFDVRIVLGESNKARVFFGRKLGVDKDYKNPKEAKYIFINGSNDVVFKHIWFGGGGNDMRTSSGHFRNINMAIGNKVLIMFVQQNECKIHVFEHVCPCDHKPIALYVQIRNKEDRYVYNCVKEDDAWYGEQHEWKNLPPENEIADLLLEIRENAFALNFTANFKEKNVIHTFSRKDICFHGNSHAGKELKSVKLVGCEVLAIHVYRGT